MATVKEMTVKMLNLLEEALEDPSDWSVSRVSRELFSSNLYVAAPQGFSLRLGFRTVTKVVNKGFWGSTEVPELAVHSCSVVMADPYKELKLDPSMLQELYTKVSDLADKIKKQQEEDIIQELMYLMERKK